MPTDHLLNTLLDRLQDPPDPSQIDAFLGTTVHLLATLSNPLNLAVLTTQFLSAPAIWHHGPGATIHDDLQTCYRVVSVYNSGANRARAAVRAREAGVGGEGAQPPQTTQQGPPRRRIGCDAWARGVAAGLDVAHSRRWQHLLVLTGILLGLETEGGVVDRASRGGLSPGMRRTLEEAIVRAANLSLDTESPLTDGPVAGAALVLALGYALPLLSPPILSLLNCDALLSLTIWAMTATPTFQRGAFLAPIAADTPRLPGAPGLHWSSASSSFHSISHLASTPLVSGLGAIAGLSAHTAQHARDPGAVLAALGGLVEFTGQVLDMWRALPLSAIDPAEEDMVLSPETAEATAPVLWGLLKKLMFSAVAVLQAVAARCLVDPRLTRDSTMMAVSILRALRNLSFITSRGGNSQFQVYTFSYLTAIDLLSRSPPQCEEFLRQIVPPATGTISLHATDRTLDLFYLNLVEHLSLTVSPEACEALIIRPALTYLNPPVAAEPGSDTPLLAASPLTAELFEASHSAILSALSVPRNAALAARMVPFYADTLSAAFPARISPRQFRLALRAVVRITSPPSPASASHPDLAETLLEMVRYRALTAATTPLPPPPRELAVATGTLSPPPPISEQTALILAIVDAVPYLPLRLVDDWLTIAAELVGAVQDPALGEPVRERFWDMLVGGEMDVDRAAMGVAWWGRGGRELLLGGGGGGGLRQEPPAMSGAIPAAPLRESKL